MKSIPSKTCENGRVMPRSMSLIFQALSWTSGDVGGGEDDDSDRENVGEGEEEEVRYRVGMFGLIARRLNADRWQLRSLNMKKLSPVLRRYVSFYERPRVAGDYARVEMKETTLNYTAAQLRFCH